MYLPPQVVTNAMLSRIMNTSDDWIVPRTGILERRFVADDVGSAELGAKASEAALATPASRPPTSTSSSSRR